MTMIYKGCNCVGCKHDRGEVAEFSDVKEKKYFYPSVRLLTLCFMFAIVAIGAVKLQPSTHRNICVNPSLVRTLQSFSF